jgi:hypothetical protein
VLSEDAAEELVARGFCVLRNHFNRKALHDCREAFWPILLQYIAEHREDPNRGPNRHFLPMPFDPPCFAPEFFFDEQVLGLVRGEMDDRIVADQWGCDAPVKGSDYQGWHVDYRRPLFPELPDLALPVYLLVVSFGLDDVGPEDGPIEIASGTHRLPREEALHKVERSEIETECVTMGLGDVLLRHPWALHRGTPNTTDRPRALLTIRYVRHWYFDSSREVHSIPTDVWRSLTPEQHTLMRFPVAGQPKKSIDRPAVRC